MKKIILVEQVQCLRIKKNELKNAYVYVFNFRILKEKL